MGKKEEKKKVIFIQNRASFLLNCGAICCRFFLFVSLYIIRFPVHPEQYLDILDTDTYKKIANIMKFSPKNHYKT